MTTRLFTSWVRRGAAAGIVEPDPTAGAYAGPATFSPAITLARDGVSDPLLPGPQLPLLGPGAVVGIDPRAIVRTDPAAGAAGVEDNFLVLAELARADLPWLFTPACPNNANRLRPWLVLVVVDASKTTLQPGTPLRRISVSDAELPDLNDCWGWTHSQVTAEDPANGAQALNAPVDPAAVSRFLCPRRLAPDTNYLACLVPATLVGAQAGLGLPLDPGAAIAPAWTAGAGQDVVLPVYYSWTFSTGARGDFKSLVQRLQGVKAASIPGFGTRIIGMSSPFESPPPLGDGITMPLDGALGTGVDAGELTGQPQTDFEQRLTKLLNFPADLNPTGNPSLSAVAPPIYGGRHAGQVRVPDTEGWLRTLNLDPRRRIAAAFGTQYVQQHKEFLMARAWDQVGAVEEANRLRALAELAAEVADRLHVRHIQPLRPSELFAVAAPARTRVTVASATTLQAATAATPMPPGAATVAFTRLARPLGPIGQRAFAGATPKVLEQGIRGVVTAAAPATVLDGINSLMSQPVTAQLPADATARMVTVGWQGVAAAEQPIQNPADLSAVRTALDNAVGSHGAAAVSVFKGTPATIAFDQVVAPGDPVALATTLTNALLPSVRIIMRLNGRIQVPTSLGGGNTTRPVMAYPQFTAPLAMALMQDHLDYLLPGLGNFPSDRVTLLVANSAWVEAFLVGANHEMNRELLWREYPTDQRGTPFQYFWPRSDGNADIPPITNWPLATPLGQNGPSIGPDLETMIVLLVRGEVLRRYPRTIVYAAPALLDGTQLTLDTTVDWTAPVFLLPLDATTTAFAYPLTVADVRSDIPNGKAGWYFVFSEPVTAPRFRFNVSTPDPLVNWDDLGWDKVPQARGFAIAGLDFTTPSGETAAGSPSWNNDAADTGRIAFARPFRVGYHADELLSGV